MSKASTASESEWTLSIPQAGKRFFNLGRMASYQASFEVGSGEKGVIPYVRVGRFKRALPRLIEKMLAGESA